MILIEIDREYDSRDSWDWSDPELRAAMEGEIASLRDGDSAAYSILVYTPHDHETHYAGRDPEAYCLHAVVHDSISGVVTDAGHDGLYRTVADIRDPYLRETVTGMEQPDHPLT